MVKKTAATMKRGRADSVLEGAMDAMKDFKVMKSSQGRRWNKMKAIIAKDSTKLCMIQVPKGFNMDSQMENALDLGHQMRKLEKAGMKRHSYKTSGDDGVKDTVVTLEIAGKDGDQGDKEFTECAHLRQVLCLMPSEGGAAAVDGDSSDDSIDGKAAGKGSNLKPSKPISAYIRVSKQACEIGSKPKSANIIRAVKVSDQTKLVLTPSFSIEI